jgi:hypothetical protein
MTAFLNALREEGTKEDCLVQIERILSELRRMRDERDDARAKALAVSPLVYVLRNARNKALDEAAFAARKAYSESADAQGIAEAILALKEPKP